MKSVAVVGAGPAGLASARTLLGHGNFKVTIFEKASQVGGIWAVTRNSREGVLSPYTPTNLSKYTVTFSDLSWESNDVKHGLGVKDDENSSTYPTAWQVGHYLKAYAWKYLQDRAEMKFNAEVKQTIRTIDNGKTTWKIATAHSQESDATLQWREFDYLIVASGFFAKPKEFMPELQKQLKHESNAPKIIHTSCFRTLDDVLPNEDDLINKKLLVVGGANSGGEVSSNAAFQMSSSKHSPSSRRKTCEIVHLMKQPLYALPPFVSGDEESKHFVPLDLKLYDLSKRVDDPISEIYGRLQPNIAAMFHESAHSLLGNKQDDLGVPEMTNDLKKLDAPYFALSEGYLEYVRSKSIIPKLGRLIRLEAGKDTEHGTIDLIATVTNGSEVYTIDNIAGVIYATGYTPSTALALLPEDVTKALQYDPMNTRLPLILESDHQATSVALPDLAFVGFYEGAYWGVIEMQARLIAKRWSCNETPDIAKAKEEAEKLCDIRRGMSTTKTDIAQYIFGDYAGIMEQSSRDTGLTRNEHGWNPREGCVTPARYSDSYNDRREADLTIKDLQETLRRSKDEGLFAARVAFRGMQGGWKIHRRLKSQALGPSGAFAGIASFHPRTPTDDSFDLEYLYIESGELTTDNGTTHNASRQYVYRYKAANDEASVWFVKDDGKTVDYLFHNLAFGRPCANESGASWLAKADHLCIHDMYHTEYDFRIKGVTLMGFHLFHKVTGPKKDYVSNTRFKR